MCCYKSYTFCLSLFLSKHASFFLRISIDLAQRMKGLILINTFLLPVSHLKMLNLKHIPNSSFILSHNKHLINRWRIKMSYWFCTEKAAWGKAPWWLIHYYNPFAMKILEKKKDFFFIKNLNKPQGTIKRWIRKYCFCTTVKQKCVKLNYVLKLVSDRLFRGWKDCLQRICLASTDGQVLTETMILSDKCHLKFKWHLQKGF